MTRPRSSSRKQSCFRCYFHARLNSGCVWSLIARSCTLSSLVSTVNSSTDSFYTRDLIEGAVQTHTADVVTTPGVESEMQQITLDVSRLVADLRGCISLHCGFRYVTARWITSHFECDHSIDKQYDSHRECWRGSIHSRRRNGDPQR